MIPFGIEPATFRFVAQRFNHCAIAVFLCCIKHVYWFITGAFFSSAANLPGYTGRLFFEAFINNPK